MSSESLMHISSQIEQGHLFTPFSADSLCTLDYLAALMEVSSPGRGEALRSEGKAQFACAVTQEYADLYNRPAKVKEACDQLEKQVQEPGQVKHAVFVLLDGYGWNLLQAFDRIKRDVNSKSFIAQHSESRAPARTVFPATTSAALSAYGSLRLPAHHAQWGWHVRLSKNGQVVQPLKGDFDFSSDLSPDDVFKFKSVFPRLAQDEGRSVAGFSDYGGTPFTLRMCGEDTPHFNSGAYCLADALPQLQTFWNAADAESKPSFAYVYAANPDHSEHVHGPFDANGNVSPGVLASIEQLDAQMRQLCTGTSSPNQRLVLMMADHGQYTVEEHVPLPRALSAMLDGPFTVEPATPSFHLKPSATPQQFRAAWKEAGLESKWRLLDQEELLATGLLGPEMGGEARRTLGDLTGIALGNYLLTREEGDSLGLKLWQLLRTEGVWKTARHLWEMRALWKRAFAGGGAAHKGHHGGCKPSEMLVPVFVWSQRS